MCGLSDLTVVGMGKMMDKACFMLQEERKEDKEGEKGANAGFMPSASQLLPKLSRWRWPLGSVSLLVCSKTFVDSEVKKS